MRDRFRSFLLVVSFAATGGWIPAAARSQAGPIVHTIAPSASTRREAQRILRLCRWTDTTAMADADRVFVVVRSSGSLPLAPSYDSLKWLRDEAQSLPNESGAQFHVYFYALTPPERLVQESHFSYDAGPDTPGADQSARARAVAYSGLVCGY